MLLLPHKFRFDLAYDTLFIGIKTAFQLITFKKSLPKTFTKHLIFFDADVNEILLRPAQQPAQFILLLITII